ncbi:mechanosensitive ion channel family protein [Acidianus sp. RZ1]|uniref:mechanosensitive ion channel family protein n=1 Tax=Acidianus sp. RZ1 TaxID=1540082 RepID=UPI0014912F5A|nr:mechanosensitive ion channel family protein [Acidianus sp. RZ1]NON61692.1 mechanosensitive ion channel family protein [Acidianus sp. RZ1]
MRIGIRVIVPLLILGIAVAIFYTVPLILHSLGLKSTSTTTSVLYYVQVATYVIIGLWIVSSIADVIRIIIQNQVGNRAIAIANSLKYLGYIVVILFVLIPLGISSSTLIAESTFTGLIIGLALQPVLANFFAGLLIMLTGYIGVGDKVRIISTQIPFLPAQSPGYKYFSADFIEHGYKGTVVDIDLFYSRVILESLRELRVPNIVLLNSAILEYTSKYSEEQIFNVRVEFPLSAVDINSLEELVREELRDFNITEGPFINEQSDKDHVIVLVRLKVSINVDWRYEKSKALKKLLRLRQELINKNQQKPESQPKA